VEVYSNLLSKHSQHFLDKIEDIAVKMCDPLSVLRRKGRELVTIAEALVLIPLLRLRFVEDYVKKYCSINDIIAETDAVCNNLKEMVSRINELIRNEIFMEWIKTKTFNLSEEGVRKIIDNLEAALTFYLADYKRNDDKLDEARELYSKAAEIAKSIGDVTNYLTACSEVLRVDVIKASSFGEYIAVARSFEDLWNKTLKNLKHFLHHLEAVPSHLGEYLVYLASRDRYSNVENLVNEYAYLLNYDEKVLVLTKLMLRILGYTKIEISSREIVNAFNDDIRSRFLPALKLALGIEANVEKECVHLEHSVKQLLLCVDAFLAVKGNSVAIRMLKEWLMDELGLEFYLEFYKFVEDLDVKSLVQFLVPKTSVAQLAFTLYSLINDDMSLARRYTLLSSLSRTENKLLSRLFREAKDFCCNTSDEKFKLTLLKLFYYHI
jgi:tetratricopeptide (TPR) repeat protein